jgi:hypothetical protein
MSPEVPLPVPFGMLITLTATGRAPGGRPRAWLWAAGELTGRAHVAID